MSRAQVVGQRLAEALGALGDLERGEAVDVDVGRGVLHRPGDVDVVVAVEVGVDAALQADLGGAELGAPRRTRAGDVVEGEQVRRAPQVERQRALGEAAELALERADVRVVDVAVVDEGDHVADGPRGAGRRRPRRPPPTSGPRAANRVTISSSPSSWPSSTPASTSATAPPAAGGAGHAGPAGSTGAPEYQAVLRRPMWSTSTPSSTCSAAGRRDPLHEHRARVVAAEALGVGAVQHRGSAGRRRASGRGRARTRGRSVSRGASAKPVRLGDLAQAVERRPGPLGVHVVGGDRRDAAPVVDAGVEQHAEVVGQVRRRLQVDVGRQDQAGQGDGLEVVVGRAGPARRASSVPGLGRKFWTMTSCTWPWRRCDAAMASRASMRSARTRRCRRGCPVVNGMASSPAASSVASRRSGVLSGEPRWRRGRG